MLSFPVVGQNVGQRYASTFHVPHLSVAFYVIGDSAKAGLCQSHIFSGGTGPWAGQQLLHNKR